MAVSQTPNMAAVSIITATPGAKKLRKELPKEWPI